jgi:hypothetical protein
VVILGLVAGVMIMTVAALFVGVGVVFWWRGGRVGGLCSGCSCDVVVIGYLQESTIQRLPFFPVKEKRELGNWRRRLHGTLFISDWNIAISNNKLRLLPQQSVSPVESSTGDAAARTSITLSSSSSHYYQGHKPRPHFPAWPSCASTIATISRRKAPF